MLAWRVVLPVRCPGPLGSCSLLCPLGALCCVCGVLSHLVPVHRCARLVRCLAFASSQDTCPLFSGVFARCVVSRVRCPGPLGSCSPLCSLGVMCCICGVLGLFLLCASPRYPLGAREGLLDLWLLFTGVPARRVVLCVWCPESVGSYSPVCLLVALRCVCAVSRATSLLFTGVPAWHVVLCVPCPGPLGSCAPGHTLGALCCCVVSWATWLLLTGVPARCVVLHVRCPGPLGSCSSVCSLGVSSCVCGVLGHLAPVHRCAHLVCCVACAVSWASCLVCTSVPAWCAVVRVRCPGALGSCSPVCSLRALCCVCGFLGHLAPVHRCARGACCVAYAVSSATWLLFTGFFAWCVVSRVRCPGPLGSSAPVCPLGALSRCAVSWGTRLLFTGVLARRVVLRVRCPGPLGSCSPVCSLLRCVACAVSWATWLLFTGVFAPCVVPRLAS